MRHFICTVGTSLLTNRIRPWEGWSRGSPLPEEAAVNAWMRDADPAAASAETNTLHRLEPDLHDTLCLLASSTREGRFCAERLRAWLAPRVRAANVREVGHLGYGAASFAERGLRSLVQVVFDELTEAGRAGRTPVLCATGGFKAEIAFLNLIGALMGVEVLYIHEQFREIVRLPRLPLAWNERVVLDHRAFFEWIDAEPRLASLAEERLRACEELRPLVEEGDDGHVYLNAAGDLLFRAARERSAAGPRACWPPSDPKPPADKEGLAGVEHHRPDGWQSFIRRLASIDCVTYVRYDAAAAGSRARVLDAETGAIGIEWKGLPLRVESTARGEAQCELVASYLRHLTGK